ncbi:Hydroxyethylthiazole kinase family-domain-containing protein [Globomyces pollinis-pini]|nr:Hydroxyethylthiazole kinase family-domain-containing protein [Globomyces pollinis-pini]
MEKSKIDYTLYLVTDSSLVPSHRTLVQTVKDSIDAGVTIVQLREKNLETLQFIRLATELLEITRAAGIPLLINDRLDVALAVDADGVHIGQSDMPLAVARKLLGPNKIIGVTVKTIEQAKQAVDGGADYLGIGTCFHTNTKKIESKPLGPSGVYKIIESLPVGTKTVTIGGIKESNAELVMKRCQGNGFGLNGLAVVSDIIAAPDVHLKVKALLTAIQRGLTTKEQIVYTQSDVSTKVEHLFLKLRKTTPLVHHITNFVVMNDTANATIALGGSPIMAQNHEESFDLAEMINVLLLNIGTLNTEFVKGMLSAGKHSKNKGVPVVLDPVGAGATALRKDTARNLLNEISIDIIKGNSGEISTVAEKGNVEMKGVDSVGGASDPAELVRYTALKEKCVVAMTGVVDYVSDGFNTYSIENGHEYMGKITGSGCMTTTAIACYAAVCEQNYLIAAIAGIASIGIAGEIAAVRSDVKGPSTFKTALIDEMYNLNVSVLKDRIKIKKIH